MATMALLSQITCSYIIKSFALWLGFVGGSSLISGIKAAESSGRVETLSRGAAATKSIIDSTIRFYGPMHASAGAIGWWASDDIPERSVALAILGAAIVVGGLGRVLSGWEYGYGAAWLRRAAWVEIVVPILFAVVGTWE